ncbi:MAG TPA: hypothetical protein EYH54_00550, partial [Nautiliaceae bacterium]|nr:hypothetical protein [Nautiliaceae bacterium]
MRLIYNTLFGIILLIASIIVAFSIIKYFFGEIKEEEKILMNIGKIINDLKAFEISDLPNYENYYLLYNPRHKNYSGFPYFIAKDPFSYDCEFNKEDLTLNNCKDFSYFYTTDKIKFEINLGKIIGNFSEALKKIDEFCIPETLNEDLMTALIFDYKRVVNDFSSSLICYSIASKVIYKTVKSDLARDAFKRITSKILKRIEERFTYSLTTTLAKKIFKRALSTATSSFTGPFALFTGAINIALIAHDTGMVIKLIKEFERLKD